jgi:hypothetical protein
VSDRIDDECVAIGEREVRGERRIGGNIVTRPHRGLAIASCQQNERRCNSIQVT